jgi:quinol monooxygenase YgiN
MIETITAAIDKNELPVIEPAAMCYILSKHGYLSDATDTGIRISCSESTVAAYASALFVFVRLHVRSGQEAAVEEVLREVLERSRAEAGCFSIRAFRSIRDPRLFYIHSQWADEVAFDYHATLPHTLHFIEAVQPLLDQPQEVSRTARIG